MFSLLMDVVDVGWVAQALISNMLTSKVILFIYCSFIQCVTCGSQVSRVCQLFQSFGTKKDYFIVKLLVDAVKDIDITSGHRPIVIFYEIKLILARVVASVFADITESCYFQGASTGG